VVASRVVLVVGASGWNMEGQVVLRMISLFTEYWKPRNLQLCVDMLFYRLLDILDIHIHAKTYSQGGQLSVFKEDARLACPQP
jgi:hypothetical protein